MATKKIKTKSSLVPRKSYPVTSEILSQHAETIDKLGLVVAKIEINSKTGMVKVSGKTRRNEAIRHHLLQTQGLDFRSLSVSKSMRNSSHLIEKRRESVAALDDEGYVQTDIAETLGVSQATVSSDLRALGRR